MNWGAIGTLVGAVGIAFAAGAWVKSSDHEIGDLAKKVNALEKNQPLLNKQGEKLKTLEGIPNQLGGLAKRLETIEAAPDLVIPEAVSKGMIAFFNLKTCPNGWKEKESIRGRYLVGMHLNGEVGKTVGTALSNLENRAAGPHSHAYQDDSVGYKAANRFEGLRTEFKGDSSVALYHRPGTTASVSPAAPEGTNAPYVQFRACEKL